MFYDLAKKDDIGQLVDLRIAYLLSDHGSLSKVEEERVRRHLPGYFERKLGKELIAFVAREENQILATAYLLIIEKPANLALPNGLEGEVLSVYTKEACRGQGICTQLMKNLLAYGKEKGLCRINLKATKEGYSVYKKVGFEEIRQNYVDMRLELAKEAIFS